MGRSDAAPVHKVGGRSECPGGRGSGTACGRLEDCGGSFGVEAVYAGLDDPDADGKEPEEEEFQPVFFELCGLVCFGLLEGPGNKIQEVKHADHAEQMGRKNEGGRRGDGVLKSRDVDESDRIGEWIDKGEAKEAEPHSEFGSRYGTEE